MAGAAVEEVTSIFSHVTIDSEQKANEGVRGSSELLEKNIGLRRIILPLAKKNRHLNSLVQSLPMKYLSRANRDLLLAALKLYDHKFSVNSFELLMELMESTKHNIKASIQNEIVQRLSKLLAKFGDEINNFKPNSDDERFELMIDSGYNLMPKALDNLFQIKTVSVSTHGRKFLVCGQNKREQFFSDVKVKFGFDNPEKFFDYTGGVAIPEGCLE